MNSNYENISLIDKLFNKRAYNIRKVLMDDEQRRYHLFVWTDVVCTMYASAMTIVNALTEEGSIIAVTLCYSILCLINLFIPKIVSRILPEKNDFANSITKFVFCIETVILCLFFCITGGSEGFSPLWCCLIPLLSFQFLRFRYAFFISAGEFLILVLLFWLPFGRNLVQFSYSDSFILRFPLFYLAFLVIAIYIEFLRLETNWQLKEVRKNYNYQYRFDSLTGILNKQSFNERLDSIVALGRAEKVSLILIQLDYFKHINETFGRDSGDRLLRAVSDRITVLGGSGSVACRWNGEEFAILIVDCDKPHEIAENIHSAIGKLRLSVPQGQISTTSTIGVATISTDAADNPAASLVRAATAALNKGISSGRNKVV